MSGQGGQATPGAPGPPLRPGPTPSAAGQTPRRWPRAWAVRVGLRGNGGRADGRERGASVAGGPGPGGASPGSRGPSRAPVGLRSSGDLRGKQRTAVSAPDTQGPCQERPQAGLAGTAPWTDAGRRPPGQETRWRPASLHAPGVPLAPDDQGVGLVPSTGFPHPPPPPAAGGASRTERGEVCMVPPEPWGAVERGRRACPWSVGYPVSWSLGTAAEQPANRCQAWSDRPMSRLWGSGNTFKSRGRKPLTSSTRTWCPPTHVPAGPSAWPPTRVPQAPLTLTQAQTKLRAHVPRTGAGTSREPRPR